MTNGNLRKIAAFDFDGTIIKGSSPVRLVNHLLRKGMISPVVCLRLLKWGAAYKLHLPQTEAHARSLVFTAFEGREKDWVDRFLKDFYVECIEGAGYIRPAAVSGMERLVAEGYDVVVVSATFGPIVEKAMETLPFSHSICTEMAVDEHGCYTTVVDGDCIEGAAKVASLINYFDQLYGPGNWVLDQAYGDHYSDQDILCFAQRGFAVSPSYFMGRLARLKHWEILDWD